MENIFICLQISKNKTFKNVKNCIEVHIKEFSDSTDYNDALNLLPYGQNKVLIMRHMGWVSYYLVGLL